MQKENALTPTDHQHETTSTPQKYRIIGNDDGPVLLKSEPTPQVNQNSRVSLTDNVQVQINLEQKECQNSSQPKSIVSKVAAVFNPYNWFSSNSTSNHITVEKVDLNAPKEQDGKNPDAGTSHDELKQEENATPPANNGPSTPSTENSYEEDPNVINTNNFFDGLNNDDGTYAELPLGTTEETAE